MVLTLLPLLAALQLFLQPVFPQGVPAAPSLSVQPPKQEYLAGDTINFRCTAPSSVNGIQGFHYYHTKESTSLTSPLRTHTHQKNLTGPEDGGPYQCSYWTDQSTSNKSNAIYIKMKARGHSWARQLVVGGSFFAINGLIFLISHLCMKSEASKQARTRDVNQYQPSIYSTPDYSSHSA
ncbi:uncharacterized protein LOC142004999 isoform X2 [Carettochelys insculpta]|uniref:uncharacterized protein LOC142004999 isoform X2 n=1 Tax=Carettochelys insculpta TaxID=44489 RepID=UPI003EC0F69A